MKFYECYAFDGIGYEKLFHHNTWRIAMLNHIEELDVERLMYFETHHETDEVFVLLEGSCHLFLTDHQHQRIVCLSLEPNKVYKIPGGVYHTHTLSKDAKVLIIEEESTCDGNSPRLWITDDIRQKLMKAYQEQTHAL